MPCSLSDLGARYAFCQSLPVKEPRGGEGGRGKSLQYRYLPLHNVDMVPAQSYTQPFLQLCHTGNLSLGSTGIRESVACISVQTPSPWCFLSSHMSHYSDGYFCKVLRALAVSLLPQGCAGMEEIIYVLLPPLSCAALCLVTDLIATGASVCPSTIFMEQESSVCIDCTDLKSQQ